VEDRVAAAHRVVRALEALHVAFHELYALKVSEVLAATGCKRIEHANLVPSLEEPFRQMGADEAAAARYKHSHAAKSIRADRMDPAARGFPILVRMHRLGALLAIALSALVATALAPSTAGAAKRHFSNKKSIWGPVTLHGKSQFPIYRDLGAGSWQYTLQWSSVAPRRPAAPRNPKDHAYRWPPELNKAVKEAKKYHIKISLLVMTTPKWANGSKAYNWVPDYIPDYTNFLTAAARKYPSVKLWMIWGEPSRRPNWMPLTPETPGSTSLTSQQAVAPRYYARLLDASYGALKAVRRSNLVIGGNTFTAGDITPYNWVRNLILPNGKRPRLDLYGHNPFTGRRPATHGYMHQGLVDFTDLPKFTKFLDQNLRGPHRKRLKIFISEFFWPTDHKNGEFNFHLTPKLQASWLSDALKITMRSKRIYTLGWYSLYDDPANGVGTEVNRGLLRRSGKKKPAYNVFRSR